MLDVGSWISRTSPAESAEPTVTDFQQRNSMQATLLHQAPQRPGEDMCRLGPVTSSALLQTHPPSMYTEMGGAPHTGHQPDTHWSYSWIIPDTPGHHGVDMSDGSVMNSLSCY